MDKAEKTERKFDAYKEKARARAAEAKRTLGVLVGAGAGGVLHGASKVYLADKKVAENVTGHNVATVAVIASPFVVPGAGLRGKLIGPAAGMLAAELSNLTEKSLAASAKKSHEVAAPVAAPAFAAPRAVQALPVGTGGVVVPFQHLATPAAAVARR